MITINQNTQFYRDMIEESRTVNINNSVVPIGYWNLLLSIRYCKLYSVGLKPHRNWKISDVKRYFGVKGDAKQIVEQLTEIKNMLKEMAS